MRILIPLYFLLFIFTPFMVSAQKPEKKEAAIVFLKTDHDFGVVEEDSGLVKVDFKFVNQGKLPLLLKDVEASCGCTTPTWTTDSVMPGGEGSIQVAFNPKNRPGPFNKTVTVTSNGNPTVSILTIEGRVVPIFQSMEAKYPHKIGGLRFKKKSIHFGNITNEQPVTSTIEVYNGSEEKISFSEEYLHPDHITVTVRPQVIDTGQVSLINVTYDATKSGNLGYTSDNIRLYTDELQDSVKSFNVFATVLDYFPPLSVEDLAKVPKLKVDKTIEDFGDAYLGETLKTTFQVTNAGKSPLALRKIRPNCTCIEVMPEKNIVQPGDTVNLSVSFEVEDNTGTQQKLISIFSNDPTAHVEVLTLKVYVRED